MVASTLADLVKVTSPTSGQGALTLGAAVPGFLSPSTLNPPLTSGTTVSYGISDPQSGNEVGQGVLTLSGGQWTLTRSVSQSNNNGQPIICTGQQLVSLTLRAEDLKGVTNGQIKLVSGAISSPVAFVDFVLPSGYTSFKFIFTNINFSGIVGFDSLALALSTTGGTTFINDATNFDSYRQWNDYHDQAGAIQTMAGDSLISNPGGISPGVQLFQSMDLILFPGTASSLASYILHSAAQRSAPHGLNVASVLGGVNPAATIPPTVAPVNYVRVQPYGNGDCNPPTSGETWISGTYTLFGVLA